jgi:electron transfer flavoprotein beta subunit
MSCSAVGCNSLEQRLSFEAACWRSRHPILRGGIVPEKQSVRMDTLHIVVFVRQVFDPDVVADFALGALLRFDPGTGGLNADFIPLVMNDTDRQALCKAVALADKCREPVEVIVISVNTRDPEALLAEAFELGASTCYSLSSSEAGGPPSARVTADGVVSLLGHLGGADLVLVGSYAEQESGVIGGLIAARLDVACVPSVREFSLENGHTVSAVQIAHDAERNLRVQLPAVLTVHDESWEMPVIDPRHLLTARAKRIQYRTPADVGWQAGSSDASPRPLGMEIPTVPNRCQFISAHDLREAAGELLQRLDQHEPLLQ